MIRLKSCLTHAILAACLFTALEAGAVILTHEVGPMDNLYNTAWPGNPYPGAIGSGVDARSVRDGVSPFDFAGISNVDVSASGCIVDAGAACTDADGTAGLFRDLTVYAMIGIWSSSGTTIDPISARFVVGTASNLSVPAGPSAFLFLAENDGVFSDNTSGSYSVRLEFEPSVVNAPAPAPLALIALALMGVTIHRRRASRCAV